MVILSVTAEGFAELAPTPITGLGRVVVVGGPPRSREALALAVELGLGALDAETCRLAFARLGTAPSVEPDPSGAAASVSLGEPARLKPLLAPHGQATLKISLTLSVDPPLFGLLRELAARDPRLVTALADEDARLTLRVGYAFSADLASVSPALFSIHLGELSLRPNEDKSPAFDALVRSLRGRVRGRGPLELDLAALARAERAAEPRSREGVRQLRAALAAPPFSLGELALIAQDELLWAGFGPTLCPAEAHGPGPLDALGLAATLLVDPAEILVLRRPEALSDDPAALLVWLRAQAEGAGGVEQLFLIGSPEPTVKVGPPAPASDRALRWAAR